MTPTTILGSWIDHEAAAAAARDLCPPDPAEGAARPGAEAPPPAPLLLGDLHQTAVFKVDRYPGPEEMEISRTRLRELKERIQRSGLIRQRRRIGAPAVAGVVLTATGPLHEPQSTPAPAPTHPLFRTQAASPAAMTAPFYSPSGAMTARIHALAGWIRTEFSPEEFLLIDSQGSPLGDFGAGPELMAASSLMGDAARRASRHLSATDGLPPGATHLDLGAGRMLSLVQVNTVSGLFCAGLIRAVPLPAEDARRLARGLKRAIEGN